MNTSSSLHKINNKKSSHKQEVTGTYKKPATLMIDTKTGLNFLFGHQLIVQPEIEEVNSISTTRIDLSKYLSPIDKVKSVKIPERIIEESTQNIHSMPKSEKRIKETIETDSDENSEDGLELLKQQLNAKAKIRKDTLNINGVISNSSQNLSNEKELEKTIDTLNNEMKKLKRDYENKITQLEKDLSKHDLELKSKKDLIFRIERLIPIIIRQLTDDKNIINNF